MVLGDSGEDKNTQDRPVVVPCFPNSVLDILARYYAVNATEEKPCPRSKRDAFPMLFE